MLYTSTNKSRSDYERFGSLGVRNAGTCVKKANSVGRDLFHKFKVLLPWLLVAVAVVQDVPDAPRHTYIT